MGHPWSHHPPCRRYRRVPYPLNARTLNWFFAFNLVKVFCLPVLPFYRLGELSGKLIRTLHFARTSLLVCVCVREPTTWGLPFNFCISGTIADPFTTRTAGMHRIQVLRAIEYHAHVYVLSRAKTKFPILG